MSVAEIPVPPTHAAGVSSYETFVNPQWVRLLDLLEMNLAYERCAGAELFAAGGRVILDFLSGYCVYNTGHNHPKIIEALQEELDRCGPSMLQSHVPHLAGELAQRLCELAGGGLTKVFFPSTGSEGLETTIKFSRAHTRRDGLLSCRGGFHGLTCGALSLMENPYWKDGFGSFLPGTEAIDFGDIDSLRARLATRKFAAFIIEPVQAEAGIRVPSREYMTEAQTLCRKYGTLFVLDEVQTGMYRTGTFLAAHQLGVEPDIVILAKALSGGLVPCAAVLMKEEIYRSVFSSVNRAFVHASTFSENSLAMRAGLGTLDVLEEERLGERATRMGELLRKRLRDSLLKYEMIREIHGMGLLCGIEFQKPTKMSLRIPFEAFRALHAGVFGQMFVMRLFRAENVLTQICGNNFMVLKAAPPLVVTEEQIDRFVGAVTNVVETIHSSSAFWSDALHLAGRAMKM